MTNVASKQYAVVKQVQSGKSQKAEDEGLTSRDKGTVSNQQIADMASPNIDQYVSALATQDDVQKTKKKYQPTIESLKEKLEKSLEDRYDNAHNMLAEAFYGFQVGTASSLLGLLGADAGELEAIRKRAYEQAKEKVQTGFERLASAYAEYEIYAS